MTDDEQVHLRMAEGWARRYNRRLDLHGVAMAIVVLVAFCIVGLACAEPRHAPYELRCRKYDSFDFVVHYSDSPIVYLPEYRAYKVNDDIVPIPEGSGINCRVDRYRML